MNDPRSPVLVVVQADAAPHLEDRSTKAMPNIGMATTAFAMFVSGVTTYICQALLHDTTVFRYFGSETFLVVLFHLTFFGSILVGIIGALTALTSTKSGIIAAMILAVILHICSVVFHVKVLCDIIIVLSRCAYFWPCLLKHGSDLSPLFVVSTLPAVLSAILVTLAMFAAWPRNKPQRPQCHLAVYSQAGITVPRMNIPLNSINSGRIIVDSVPNSIDNVAPGTGVSAEPSPSASNHTERTRGNPTNV